MLPKSLGLVSKWAFNLDNKQNETKIIKLLNGCKYAHNNPPTLQVQLDYGHKTKDKDMLVK